MLFIRTVPSLRKLSIKEGRTHGIDVFHNENCGELIPFCKLMLSLVEKYNKIVDDDKFKISFDVGIWRNDISPKFGQSRIKNYT